MDDKELADKVVALGVGRFNEDKPEGWQYCAGGGFYLRPEEFVRDWRVVGALLEKKWGDLEGMIALSQIDFIPKDESLPRALIEACIEHHIPLTKEGT